MKPEGKIVGIDGRNTAFALRGSDGPAVVLISGLGDGMESWAPIFDRVAARTTTFAYDRPGYGDSTPHRHSRNGRDGAFVARHLKASLASAGVTPPYIVVGHSMGGLYALGFAKAFSNDVVGMVLLDMRAPTYSQACARQKSMRSEAPWYVTPFLPQHMKAEIRGAKAAEQQAQTPEKLGKIPVTVIAASKPDPGIKQAFYELWRGEQKKFSDRLVAGRFVVAEDSAHHVHHDNPELVIDEILAIFDVVAASLTQLAHDRCKEKQNR